MTPTIPALCVGGAASVWHDIEAVERVTGPWPGIVIAANNIGIVLRRLDEWCTLHPTGAHHFPAWFEARRQVGYPDPYASWLRTWGHASGPRTQHVLRHWSNGSSGLLAVGVAWHLGCSPIILAGIRMDDQRNAFRDEKRWVQCTRYQRGWTKRVDMLRGRVFSMSGWTRQLLGEPPQELLESLAEQSKSAA